MDGLEATRCIRADERDSHIPIIAMTAFAMKGDRERCLDAGMDNYVSKPLNVAMLFTTIEQVTDAAATHVETMTSPTASS